MGNVKGESGFCVLVLGFSTLFFLGFSLLIELIELCGVRWRKRRDERERGISGVDEEDDMCDSCEEGDDWVWRR